MKSPRILLAAAVLLPVAASAQVTIKGVEPSSGGTYTLPAIAAAHASSPKGVSGWNVYFGNTLAYQSTTGLNGILNTTVTKYVSGDALQPGTYQVTITAFDNSGAHSSVVIPDVSVVASSIMIPSSGVKTYSNLQNTSQDVATWTQCSSNTLINGKPCAGGTSQSTASSNLLQPAPVGSPLSLSGSAMDGQSSSNQVYYNTMYYQHLGCPNGSGTCNTVKNMVDDVWFYTEPSPSNGFQQLEFDPDLFDSNRNEYFGTVACETNGSSSGNWRVWNMAANSWQTTTHACSIAPQQWHHLQLYVTYDTTGSSCTTAPTKGSPCYAYQTLVFDGATVFQNANEQFNALQLPVSVTPTVNIEQQIDNFPAVNTANQVLYDDYNLSVW